MKLERPIITSDRYNNLNSNDMRREYERDVTLYNQALELERIANKSQEINVNIDNTATESLAEEIRLSNELLQDQIMLQNLKGKDKTKYLKEMQEKANQRKRNKELEEEVHTIFKRGADLTSSLERFSLDIGEAVADRKLKEVRTASKVVNQTKSKEDIFARWFFVLIMGIVGILVYSSISGARGIEFNMIFPMILVSFLVVYPIVAGIRAKNNENKYVRYKDTMNKLDTDYTPEIIKFRVFVEDIPVKEAITQYKEYCRNYINDIKDKYTDNKKDFKDLDPYIFEDTLEEIDNI